MIVTIPDHMHATARSTPCSAVSMFTSETADAHGRGSRDLLEAAEKYKVATQMGNQGYSNEGTRQCAEMIWSGAIGNVTEVHAWTDRPSGRRG